MSALIVLTLLAAVQPALVERLSDELRAADSATAVLQSHCDSLGLPGAPRIRADKDDVRVRAPAGLRRHLRISPSEPIVHRRVALTCGNRILSRADNWYVPSRLTAEMNRMLASGDTPFGVVVRPLAPHRRALSIEMLARPGKPLPPALFVHRALVIGADGRPLAEVAETYQRALAEPVEAAQ